MRYVGSRVANCSAPEDPWVLPESIARHFPGHTVARWQERREAYWATRGGMAAAEATQARIKAARLVQPKDDAADSSSSSSSDGSGDGGSGDDKPAAGAGAAAKAEGSGSAAGSDSSTSRR